MNKKIKKIVAVVLSCAMVMSMGISVFAAVPATADTFTATVENVESGLTVTAYQIVDATYGTNGLTGYTVADGVEIEDIEAITADEVSAIVQDINSGSLTLESAVLTEGDDGSYTADLGAGTWIILVSDSGTTIYNPMIVSGYYTDANDADTLVAGSVDADGDFVEGEGEDAVTIYAKSTTTSVEKVIVKDEEEIKGADYDIGDVVSFKISTSIPDYSDAYDDGTAVFTITDTMSDGLDAVTADDITVSVNDTEVAADETTYTVTIDGQVIKIAFDSDYIIDNVTASVTVEYTTTVNDSATLAESLDENTNSVELEFTNEYTTYDESGAAVTSTETDDDIVYVYTFAITDEIVKTSEDGTATAEGTNVTVTNALEGATFTIYTDADCTTVYTNDVCDGTAVSDENGYVSFEGLETGTYYITETEAPEGYYINETIYQIDIEATYNEDGTLASYTITVTADSTASESTYTITYAEDGDTVTASVTPTVIVDSDIETLPSTGGNGLYAVIGISLVAMAGAAAIAFKKKSPVRN